MMSEAIIFTTLSCIGLLFYGFGTYAILFKPEWGQRFINLSKGPWVPWTMSEDAAPFLKGITFLGFFAFLCITCLVAYGWFWNFVN